MDEPLLSATGLLCFFNSTGAKSITSNQNCSSKMKKKLIFFYLFIACLFGHAQKYDYTWLTGYGSTLGYSTNYQHWYGISRFDFGQQPVSVVLDSLGFNFDASCSAISDVNGNLLFYCNGVTIHNSMDGKIENGDSLACIGDKYFMTSYYPSSFSFGMPYRQYHLFLPNPLNSNYYDMFYAYIDTFNIPAGLTVNGKKILTARVDMTGNNGLGIVSRKDVVVATMENNAAIAAVKHANGKDWWLITNVTGTNCYNVMLYEGYDSISFVNTVCSGGQTPRGEMLSTTFSTDGSKLITARSSTDTINVFDFDRCSGEITLYEQMILPELKDSSGWYAVSIEFSPDSRYMYIFCGYRIFQFDMQSASIEGSRQTVATYNPNHYCPFPQLFYYSQLAPDGKIYFHSYHGNYCLGLISNPNSGGAACSLNDTGFIIPSFALGVPYYPNYRLGALSGSPCDTISSLNETERAAKEKQVKVFPNPATENVTIDYGFTDWSKKGEITMEIANELGQVVYAQVLPQYSGFQRLNVGGFASGMYQVFIKRRGLVVAVEKLVKE